MISKVMDSSKPRSRARDRAILLLDKPNPWLSRSIAEVQTATEVVYNIYAF